MAQIIFSNTAVKRIRKIHSYYTKKVSVATAQKIIDDIFSTISLLEHQPMAWEEEEFLKKMRKGHRRIISGNYKIIYRIISDTIFITDIFDSRQDPDKLKP